MSALLKLTGFFFWAGVLPVAMGALPISFLPRNRRRIHTLIISGYMANFALFELIGVPILLLTTYGDFALLVRLFVPASLLVSALGIWRCARTGGMMPPAFLEALLGRREGEGAPAPVGRQETLYWGVFFCLLAHQIYMAYTRASFDGDDAYYVAQSLQTWQTGTMYHYIPYTGITTSLDVRHALAMLPMWTAMVSRLCATHPTIVSHTMIPMVFLPLADMCVFSVGRALMHRMQEQLRRRLLPAFMVLMAFLQIYGNISIYTPETFLLMRTWQGKTVFVYMVVPLAYYCLLLMAHRLDDGEELTFVYILMTLLSAASGFTTGMAPFLLAMILGTGSLILAVRKRRFGIFGRTVLCCLPSILYGILLVYLLLPTYLMKFYPG